MDLKSAMTRLSLWGLLPFAIAAAGVWLSPTFVPAGLAYDFREIALVYAAVVASYLAGVGAGGLLARGSGGGESLAPGMIAALVLWVNAWPQGALYLSLPSTARYLIAIIVFIYLFIRDRRAADAGILPAWYGALRTRLVFWSCLMLGAIFGNLVI